MIFLTQEDELDINLSFFAIYLYAYWEPTHKKNILVINTIEQKYKIICFAIDVDYFKGLCRRFNAQSIPTIIIFNNGIEKGRCNKITISDIGDILNIKDKNNE